MTKLLWRTRGFVNERPTNILNIQIWREYISSLNVTYAAWYLVGTKTPATPKYEIDTLKPYASEINQLRENDTFELIIYSSFSPTITSPCVIILQMKMLVWQCVNGATGEETDNDCAI